MYPPTKFEIMRINRGFTDYVNHKHELLGKIDCAELEVLRTLRQGEEEHLPDPEKCLRRIGERMAAAPSPAGPERAPRADVSTLPWGGFFMPPRRAPEPEPQRSRWTGWWHTLFHWRFS